MAPAGWIINSTNIPTLNSGSTIYPNLYTAYIALLDRYFQ